MEAPFDITYEGLTAKVSEHELQEMRIFRITFTGTRKPQNGAMYPAISKHARKPISSGRNTRR